MSVTHFPATDRAAIEDPAEIAAVEGVVSAIAGLMRAQGGEAALAGRDLYDMSVEGRALLLSDMYDAGEVIFGWRDPRSGDVANVALEKLTVGLGPRRVGCWRAEVYVEDEAGHALRGGFVNRAATEVADRLLTAVNRALAEPLPSPATELAALAATEGGAA